MRILAIETATEACSAALLSIDNSKTSQKMAVRFQLAPREHTKLILPMLDEVLEEGNTTLNDVDAIAFGRGPGAFTGLRIAAGIAQGVALAADIPVVPVSTLAALAQDVLHDSVEGRSVVVALDARMNEVYWGKFIKIKDGIELKGTEQVSHPEALLESIKGRDTTAVGNGWEAYLIDDLPENITLLDNSFPSAEYIAHLALPLFQTGQSIPAEDAQPIYIRDNVAKKSSKVT